MRLTEEGKAFLLDAQQILAVENRAKQRFEQPSPEKIELLTIGCFNYPGLFRLAQPLRRLRQVKPNIHAYLRVIPFQHIYSMLEEGELDAILGFREADTAHKHTVYREIARIPTVCLLPPDHPLAGKAALKMEQIQNEHAVLFPPLPGAHPAVHLQKPLLTGKKPTELFFCESAEAIAVLTAAGCGVSVLPEILVPLSPLLAVVPVEDAPHLSYGVTSRSAENNQTLKTFIRLLKENFST